MIEKVRIPKVSVCVITYNQEKYIRQCLQSILDQETNFVFEVIIGDDCSTDGTRAIVQDFATSYPDIVKPIYQEKNIDGAFHNYLTVHNAARGEYVAHVDGDDICLAGKLQKQSDFLDTHGECAVVWHRVNFFDDAGTFFPGDKYDNSVFDGGKVTFPKALRIGTVSVHSSTMYRKCARKTVKPDFITLDLFFAWEFLSYGWGMILSDVLGEYRVNAPGAITKSSKSYLKNLYAHHAKYFFERYPARRRDIFIFALTNCLIDLRHQRKSAFRFLLLALQTASFVGPKEFVAHLRDVRKLRIPQLTFKR